MSEPAIHPQKTAWPRVFLLFGAGVAVAFQIGKVPGALPLLDRELSLGLFLAGWVVSIFNAISSATGALFGAAADRFGHRRVALAGMAVTAAGSVLGGLADGAFLLLFSRIVEGFGFLLTVVSIPPLMLAQVAPGDRHKAMGLWGAYMPTGMAFLLFASGPALEVMDWRALWMVTAGLIVAVALMISAFVPPPEKAAPKGEKRSARDILHTATRPGPVLLGAVFLTYAGQFLAVMSFLPFLLVEQAGFTPRMAAIVGAIAVAVNIAGNLASGFLLERGIARSRLIIAVSAVMAVSGALVFIDALPVGARIFGAILFSTIAGIIPGSLFAGAPLHAPRPALVSSVNGLLMQGAALGQFIGPPIVGLMVSLAGNWSIASVFCVVAAAITAFSAVLLGRIETRLSG